MRNPNGYGSVVKLSGNRRRPFMVKRTVGYNIDGNPILEIIGYYSDKTEALLALAKFNENPYDVNLSKSTMAEIYKAWAKETEMKSSMKQAMTAAYKHCAKLHDVQYKTLRKGHMQECIDNCGRGYSTKSNIKTLFLALDRYAFDHDIISKCYSQNLSIGQRDVSSKHRLVEDAEVRMLWQHAGEPFVDETLFMLYTGTRVSEMLRMRSENVDLANGTMTGGIKTAYGKDRLIPIHADIRQLVESHVGGKYLFQFKQDQDNDVFTRWWSRQWKDAMEQLNFNHLTHDCRHTVRSKLDSAGANKVAIDRILGHSSNSIGEKVYTHKTVEELKEALALLSY